VIKLNSLEIIDNKCSLGEGICVKNDASAWVDIDQKEMIYFAHNSLSKYFLSEVPSNIFDFSKSKAIIGTDMGIIKLNLNTNKIQNLSKKIPWNSKFYRTNDGCIFEDTIIIGVMHKFNPVENIGGLYRFDNGVFTLLDNNINIPNSFIRLGKNEILISDSLTREIWLYKFDDKKSISNKRLWYKFEDSVSPDGGCIIDDKILFALWDGSSIAVFSKTGKLEQKISLPVPRPTNCKYNKMHNKIWITSASVGLSKYQIQKFPISGKTLVYSLNKV